MPPPVTPAHSTALRADDHTVGPERPRCGQRSGDRALRAPDVPEQAPQARIMSCGQSARPVWAPSMAEELPTRAVTSTWRCLGRQGQTVSPQGSPASIASTSAAAAPIGQVVRLTYIMVYARHMARHRTNIYLDDRQLDALRERSLASHRSVADLVREAVDRSLDPPQTATPVAAPVRLASAGYPKTAADWARRPYFLQEAQFSWADVVGMLHSVDDERRRWALTRLLDGGRWEDVWRLVTADAVRADLPHLRFRGRWFWDELLDQPA